MNESLLARLDPELVEPVTTVLNAPGGLDYDNIPASRENAKRMSAAMKKLMPVITGVLTEDRLIPGPAGAPDVPVRIYRPEKRTGILPALLWIHGGGYIMGDIDQEDNLSRQLTLGGDCVVVSVDYRLAPEDPFPAPVEDCYAALKWLANHGKEIGVDTSRIAIGGASAGGGLCAGLALLTRDRGEIDVLHQFLIYPMIDDRTTQPAGELFRDALFWTRESNLVGWRCYLGCDPAGDNVSCYAAAARAESLAGLSPAYIAVGDLDLFAEENVEYARRLIRAGVPTELHVYPGGHHAFDAQAPKADISRRFTGDMHRALRRALHGIPA